MLLIINTSSLGADLISVGRMWLIPALILTYGVYCLVWAPLFASPLRRVPGPKAFAITKWRLALSDWKGTRTPDIHKLHDKYGSAVRVGPNEVSFSSLSALRTIYGAGSGFERTDFYRMFDVYGRQNLFTFAGVKQHADRKKIIAHAYSKSVILSPQAIAKPLIEKNVKSYLELMERETNTPQNIFLTLHWFSLDSITGFLYGDEHGGTHALRGNEADRMLLNDILDPARRRLSWFAVHMKRYTKWLYTRTGLSAKAVDVLGLLPMRKPATYTGIRAHALQAWNDFETAMKEEKIVCESQSIVEKLWKFSIGSRAPNSTGRRLDGLDIASEAADHFLAGIDTTSDTIMFAIWALSRPEHRKYQDKLIREVDSMPEDAYNADGNPTVEAADRLTCLDAVIKETLRLFAPLPASEPRSLPKDTIIDGHIIPAGTTVAMSPYTLHRNPEVFPEPLKFKPERWLGECGDLIEMKKCFWAFSSGGRMCIGIHLAMAEMTALLSAIYRNYTTHIHEKQGLASPGITSRFEVFGDETSPSMIEHECWITFRKRSKC
ncbi:cytochrome P450 [Xylariaceae sp. FL1272]|nr:cytochrome P450 [Xylariaceae sp. FL1272]